MLIILIELLKIHVVGIFPPDILCTYFTAWFWTWPGLHDFLRCHSSYESVTAVGRVVLLYVDTVGNWQWIWNPWSCHWTNHGVEDLPKHEEGACDSCGRCYSLNYWLGLGLWPWVLRLPDIWRLLGHYSSAHHCFVPVHWCCLGLWKWQVCFVEQWITYNI